MTTLLKILERPRAGTKPATLLALALFFVAAASLSSQHSEKRLSIYSPNANYFVSIVDRRNVAYVGLIDVLEPLGKVVAQGDKKWRLQFTPANGTRTVELEFNDGKRRAKVRGTNFDLSSDFHVINNRGYVPLASLPNLLPRLLELTVDLREPAHRLFIGTAGIKSNAEIRKSPSRLVLSFSGPVNPFIATENNNVRLVFQRDAVLPPSPETMQFGDPLISSANFAEINGVAEFTVQGTSPMLASFSDGGKTITIAAAPQQQTASTPAQQAPAQGATTAIEPASSTQGAPPAQVTPGRPSLARFTVMIDAGHGGEERGAALTETLAEKDVALALARHIHRELETRGINASLTRSGDTTLGLDERAAKANTSRAIAYISVHADSLGSGMRVYTALLPPAPPAKPRAFLPWQSAQAAFLESSSALAGSVAAECNNRKIPVRAMAAAVRPLNSIATTAISVELAPPPEGTVEDISSEKYQQSIASAVAAGVAAVRQSLEVRR